MSGDDAAVERVMGQVTDCYRAIDACFDDHRNTGDGCTVVQRAVRIALAEARVEVLKEALGTGLKPHGEQPYAVVNRLAMMIHWGEAELTKLQVQP